MRLAWWFRGLAETIFSLNSFRSDKYRSIGKVRDREVALASTRDACATPRNPPLIPFCPPCREYANSCRGQRPRLQRQRLAGLFASRRPDDDREQNRNRHHPRDDMERTTVIPGSLTH